MPKNANNSRFGAVTKYMHCILTCYPENKISGRNFARKNDAGMSSHSTVEFDFMVIDPLGNGAGVGFGVTSLISSTLIRGMVTLDLGLKHMTLQVPLAPADWKSGSSED